MKQSLQLKHAVRTAIALSARGTAVLRVNRREQVWCICSQVLFDSKEIQSSSLLDIQESDGSRMNAQIALTLEEHCGYKYLLHLQVRAH